MESFEHSPHPAGPVSMGLALVRMTLTFMLLPVLMLLGLFAALGRAMMPSRR